MEANDYNENYNTGWIKLFRSIKEHWVFENDKYFKWWVLMMFEVNHSSKKFNRNYKVYTIEKGQSVNSLRTWANLFNTTPKTVSKFFKLLESDSMISIKKIGKGKQALTLITIENYATYQNSGKQTLPQEVNKEETKSKQTLPTNKNVKNYKNEKKIEIPSLSEFISYARERKPKVNQQQVSNKYESWKVNDWKDGNDKPIKNWKSKLLNTLQYLDETDSIDYVVDNTPVN